MLKRIESVQNLKSIFFFFSMLNQFLKSPTPFNWHYIFVKKIN